MTTATHGLDSASTGTSATTTVAELLARNGNLTGRTIPGRRSRSNAETTDRFPPVPAPSIPVPSVPASAGQFSSTPGSAAGQFDRTRTPIIDPTSRHHADDDAAPTMQYRYDKTALAAMIADGKQAAEDEKPSRNGRKIAGIAFAGAMLFGGFGMLTATQGPDDQDAAASGIIPTNNTPEAAVPLAAAPVGAQVAGLAGAPTGTAEIPAQPPAAAVKSGNGTASAGSSTRTAKTTPKAAAPTRQAVTPQLPKGTYVWPFSPNGHGQHHAAPGGGKHRRR